MLKKACAAKRLVGIGILTLPMLSCVSPWRSFPLATGAT
jgi:hypothetical protein